MATSQIVIITGRLGKDPKLSYTPSGTAKASFSVATDEGYKDKQTGQKVEQVEWHNIVAWADNAEFCGNYLGKGRLVQVIGKLKTRKWQDQATGQDRYITEIIADRVLALDKQPDRQQGYNNEQNGYQQPQNGYQQPQGGYQQPQPRQQPRQQHASQGGYSHGPGQEDLGPAFPSEASGMDDVPF